MLCYRAVCLYASVVPLVALEVASHFIIIMLIPPHISCSSSLSCKLLCLFLLSCPGSSGETQTSKDFFACVWHCVQSVSALVLLHRSGDRNSRGICHRSSGAVRLFAPWGESCRSVHVTHFPHIFFAVHDRIDQKDCQLCSRNFGALRQDRFSLEIILEILQQEPTDLLCRFRRIVWKDTKSCTRNRLSGSAGSDVST